MRIVLTLLIEAGDYPSFSLPLDTPSKLFQSDSPDPWRIGSGLTPSLFGNSLNPSRGLTPSITDDAAEANGEPNPFELSLGAKRHSIATGTFDEANPVGLASDHQFDILSSSTLFGGRKRAMSSPAIHTPGGSSLDFLVPSSQAPPISALDNFHLKPSKRPRIDSLASSALSTSDKFFSSNERESDESPASSVVDTPPDSATFLPSVKGKMRKSTGDIEVNTAFYPVPSTSAPQPSTSALFSQLQQQRSAMLATGTAAFSQNAPLPIDPNALDVTVKTEAADDILALRPRDTQRQSKKGKGPAMSFASTSASVAGFSEEGTPAPTPKRKGGRKKASSVKPAEGEKMAGEEEDDEDLKRKQFLERNRIAACKSRQKKKEKTAALERLSADLCNRNHVLQQTALALRQEALTLRQLMHAHQGCNCEHAQGYIIRDQQGGGLEAIEQLAGHTLHLDYSVPPRMGTEDDVYAFIDRPGGGVFPAPGGAAYTVAQIPGPAIPVVNKPSVAHTGTASPRRPASKAANSSTRSMVTRRTAAAAGAVGSDTDIAPAPPIAQAMQYSDSDFSGLERLDTAAALEAGMDPSAPTSAVDPATQAILDMPFAKHHRANSAPPTTPGWDGAAPKGDYFAPKSTTVGT
ncbi:hypothetical protein JCM3770_003435 [Rhodotorula araucariae]